MHKKSLNRHVRERHVLGDEKLFCDGCGGRFLNRRTLAQHVRSKGGKCVGKTSAVLKLKCCRLCKLKFKSVLELLSHKREKHVPQRKRVMCHACLRKYSSHSLRRLHQQGCEKFREKRAAARRRIFKARETFMCPSPPESAVQWTTDEYVEGNALVHTFPIPSNADLQLSLIKSRDVFIAALKRDMLIFRRLKWYLVAHVSVQDGENGEKGTVQYMRCAPLTCLRVDEVSASVEEGITGVINSFSKAVSEGSKVLFDRVDKVEMRVAKYSPIRGSSYLPLPDWLNRSTKGLINIKNFNDEKCFLWSCLAARYLPRPHPERVGHYLDREGEFDMTGIKYPVSIHQIDRFESNNRVTVSVFGLENSRTIIPLRVPKRASPTAHINLLYIQDQDSDSGEGHYVFIRDKSRFLSHLYRTKRHLFWCDNCLTPQFSKVAHDNHLLSCLEFANQAVQMPSKPSERVMKFKDYEKQMKHDYTIYADLESVLLPLHSCARDPSQSGSTKTNVHKACGYCYVIVDSAGNMVKEPVLGHGENGEELMREFLRKLKAEEQEIMEKRGPKYELDMTEASQKAFDEATTCYLCGDNFKTSGVSKVRDHDHSREFDNYRGAACMAGCNLNLKRQDFIPVFFHGLSNYDIHHLVSEIGYLSDGSDLKAIPKTKERYISFMWGNLRFLDSFNFLSSPLEKLVQDVKPEDMKHLNLLFPDDSKRALVGRKGIYPYSYFDSYEKFSETTLPPPSAFRNDLSGQDISDDDYQHAQNVFKCFNMSTLLDYHDLYLLVDTIQLCDVMECFRSTTMQHMKLDVVHYFTTPGYTWSAALLYTKQRLELISDVSLYQMFEKGLRGGVATVNHRHVEANNHYIPDTYDETKPSEYLMYFDANNLYAAGLSSALPVGGFRFLKRFEIEALDITQIDDNGETGYLFEVDLEYPEELHDLHNDFCLAPEHMKPMYDHLSPLQKRLLEIYGLEKNASTSKLIPNLFNKQNYVVFGSTLKLYLELGLKVTRISRVISFQQKAWLAPYIEFNTKMRQQAMSEFLKALWKLKNNACFGKSVEQVRNRKEVVFTKSSEKFKKLVRSPLFDSFEIFDHNLACVEKRKARVQLNKPVYTGQAVLDISKEIMYRFHYKCMKPLYGDRITVCGTDTDSLIYKIQTDDVYADMKRHMDWFDTSDYPKGHQLHSLKNKKVVGKMKDEMNGTPIQSYVGLRAKMYSFRKAGGVQKCVGKGIPRAALKRQLKYADYLHVLTEKTTKNVTFSKISTDQRHHLYTTFSSKKGLSCYDDKRYILDDNITTMAFGHFKIRAREGGAKDVDDETHLQELIECMDEML